MDPETQAYLAGLISFARIGPHPSAGADDQFLVATAHHHLAVEDVPGVVQVVVNVQRGRRTGRQSHLEYHGAHSGCAEVLDVGSGSAFSCLRESLGQDSTI
jgi:hypothetical protein